MGEKKYPPPPRIGPIDDENDNMDEDEDGLGPHIWITEHDRQPPQNYRANFSARKYPMEIQVYLQWHEGYGSRTKKGLVFMQAEFEKNR